ncbi:hypothetical protein [Streptomyces sp. ISL-11]|uniref:hypothetical protein n=1 Tax=Streptomyces sp. ISL-11 TaxID=2819174 RepID=UPI001BE9F68C|nr:hypothetical protein [Streptomyces sp. ISL-11]MBT2382468.1 hypothetical protein [Streptomyces sp. ISL-11]
MSADAYDSLRTLNRRCTHDPAPRTMFLSFHRQSNDPRAFDVHAHGDALPFDGNGELRGILRRDPAEIASAVDTMLRCWLKRVVRHKQHPQARSYCYDGLPADTFGEEKARDMLKPIGLELARAGHALFEFIFSGGDPGLTRIGNELRGALRQGPQTITVTSDDLFVPWGMLYLPPDPTTHLYRTGAAWERRGFLGYSHLIEHTLKFVEGYEYLIGADMGEVRSGLHFDLRIKGAAGADGPLDRVRDILQAHSKVQERSLKEQVAEALCDPLVQEQIMLFGAHGSAVRHDARGSRQAQVVLTDDEPIRTSDLEYWGTQRGERLPNPLCYMMVCEGARTTLLLHEGLGKALFNLGVGCLIGPQIEVPKTFASHYTCRFFEEFFRPGRRAASVAQALTRELFDTQATPLGLTFTLLRGIDNQLVARPR